MSTSPDRAGRSVTASPALQDPPAHPLTVLIASEPGMAERLLAAHVDDGSGHCLSCPAGGQSGHHRWPGTIHYYAAVAQERHR